jgi:hypothetical protein
MNRVVVQHSTPNYLVVVPAADVAPMSRRVLLEWCARVASARVSVQRAATRSTTARALHSNRDSTAPRVQFAVPTSSVPT